MLILGLLIPWLCGHPVRDTATSSPRIERAGMIERLNLRSPRGGEQPESNISLDDAPAHLRREWPRALLVGAEWLALLGWTLLLVHRYLNLDPAVVPAGREYLTSIYAHFMWDDAKRCGACAFWYGHVRGGHPAF